MMSTAAGLAIDARPLVAASIYMAACVLIAELVSSVVWQPYLDEIFHVPQAQQYCRGEMDTYDPKLTTPPGLYYTSLALANAVYYAKRVVSPKGTTTAAPCETLPQLRYTCLLAMLCLPWLLSYYKHESRATRKALGSSAPIQIRNVIKPTSAMEAMTVAAANPSKSAQTARRSIAIRQDQASKRRRRGIWGVVGSTLDSLPLTLEVHTISLLPPLWFFGFLYYTDVPSTVAVVAMFSAAKRDKHVVASLLGCASLTMRQTNIVWILFAMGTSLLRKLSELGLRNEPLSRVSWMEQLRSVAQIPLWPAAAALIQIVVPYTPVAVLSGVFIARNGSIVLGDQEHHQAALHWAQPLYCVTLITFFAWPALLSSLTDVPASALRGLRKVSVLVGLTALSLAAIHFGTIVHPFLLADNRHYTFYVWRKVINRTPWTRYALAPFYALMLRVWWFALSQENSLFWLVGFSLCTCAAIVPSPLIEPRYFLIPYLVVRLHLFSDSKEVDLVIDSATPEKRQRRQDRSIRLWALAVEGLWYAAVNAVTMYLFLYRPFHWPDSVQWQRFMW